MSHSGNKHFAKEYPLRVLVAEDHELNQHLFLSMLRRMGYAPQLVGDGSEVVALASKSEFDCVLMDINMPVMDGLVATRKIREVEREQGLAASYIVAVTANAMAGDREGFLSTGMDDYMAKPFSMVELREVLIRCWKHRAVAP